eukprot:gene12461-biopygen5639
MKSSSPLSPVTESPVTGISRYRYLPPSPVTVIPRYRYRPAIFCPLSSITVISRYRYPRYRYPPVITAQYHRAGLRPATSRRPADFSS